MKFLELTVPGRLLQWLPGLLLAPQLLLAQSISELTLADALAAALSTGVAGEERGAPPYKASSWLAGWWWISSSEFGAIRYRLPSASSCRSSGWIQASSPSGKSSHWPS